MPAWMKPELISRLDALTLHVGWVKAGRRGGGRFPVNRRGSSIEFADYLPYVSGDDIRAIDWNLYARLERLYVRKYREEIALSVEILIDATPSMLEPAPVKLERAKALAFCMGYIALKEDHHVRVHAVGAGRAQSSPWFTKLHDYKQLLASIESVQPQGDVDVEAWMRTAVLRLRMHGGQALWITDGMIRPAAFFKTAHRLLMQHVEPKVLQVLTREEMDPDSAYADAIWVDSETGEERQLGHGGQVLARAMREHNELLARFCKRNAIAFAQYRTTDSLEGFLVDTLTAQGFLS